MELFTPGHLLVLAIVVAVLFFGWKQLPDMARSLGRSLRIFKTEVKGLGDDDQNPAQAPAASLPAGAVAPTAAPVPPVAPVAPSVEPTSQPPAPAADAATQQHEAR